MTGHDPSRFDYLFDPIDGDREDAGDVDVLATHEPPRRRGFLLAMAAAAVFGAGLGVVVLWPRPADAVQLPAGVITTTSPRLVPTTSPVVAIPSPTPAPEPASTAAPPPPVPSTVPPLPPPPSSAPEPSPEPSPVPTASPSVRAPMSVSPAPRPAFPNQHPNDRSDGPGGLLPGLGGLL